MVYSRALLKIQDLPFLTLLIHVLTTVPRTSLQKEMLFIVNHPKNYNSFKKLSAHDSLKFGGVCTQPSAIRFFFTFWSRAKFFSSKVCFVQEDVSVCLKVCQILLNNFLWWSRSQISLYLIHRISIEDFYEQSFELRLQRH